jgi:gliding motility-associated-like protein
MILCTGQKPITSIAVGVSAVLLLCLSFPSQAQIILNGDLEINSAPAGMDQFDLSIAALNSLVPYCHNSGSSDQRELHLITSHAYGGPPQNGDWFVAIRDEQLAFELSQPLIPGVTYHISFYDRRLQDHCSSPVQIGVSNNPYDFGLLVYTTTEVPAIGEWSLRNASFTVAYPVDYITVRGQELLCIVQLDNLCLDRIEPCVPYLAFQMPNVFTPNGDGLNDVYTALSFGNVGEASLTIMDRWGNTIHSGDLRRGWSGTHNGRPCSEGVYFWNVIYSTEYREVAVNGSLMLLR